LLNRRPPFGQDILAAVQSLPDYTIAISEEAVSANNDNGPVTVTLFVEAGLASTLTLNKSKKRGGWSLGMTSILLLTSDFELVDFRRIPSVFCCREMPFCLLRIFSHRTKSLQSSKSFIITASLTKPSQTITAYISPVRLSLYFI
jgi:ATP-dependent DNA helicase HFM1/MER3